MIITVKAPASSANLGPGFDSLGVALNMYNTAEFEILDSGLEILIMDDADFLPQNEENYVYKSFKHVYEKAGKPVPGVRIKLWSDIPVSRGLGSSSSSIILGLMGANRALGDYFSKDELVNMATEVEGHPDNVAPAILGGFVAAIYENGKVTYSRTDVPDTVRFAAIIPDFYMQTKAARGILPKYIPFRNGVYNLSHASLVTAAFTTGKFELLRYAIKDRMHQRYRFPKIKSSDFVVRNARRYGALCSYLSGAGPTIMAILDKDFEQFQDKMNKLIKTNLKGWKLEILTVDNEGATYK